MAVVTAMPPNLFVPCLEHLGVKELFDELCSVDNVGGRGKGDGMLFRHAARRLGVEPADCAVFEDVLAGIQGAKAAGMRAYCVRDPHAAHDFAAMEALADGAVVSLSEMRAFHGFPDPKRCIIFSAVCEGDPKDAYVSREGDFVLCADGGWKIAEACGVQPHMVLGDFDSSDAPDHGCVERHPVMKDDTDTLLCVRRAIALGYDDILIVGGFGGRLDHTIANLQTLHFAAAQHVHIAMDDGLCRATAVVNGSVTVSRRPGKLSVFSLTPVSSGVSIRGALYTLENAELTNLFPIGVSNEYASESAGISVANGALLVVQTGAEG
jgi:thiamine pyrophosphokinase